MTANQGEHDLAFDLLAIYAVDALEPAEIDFVSLHVADCDECTTELDRLRETITHSLVEIEAVAPFWDELLAAARLAEGGHSGRDVWVEAVTLLGERLLDHGREFRRLAGVIMERGQSYDSLLRLALVDPKAAIGALRPPGGHHSGLLVILPSGSGFLAPMSIPEAPEGHTYQLWAVQSAPPLFVSIGVLGSRLVLGAFRYVGPAVSFLVTDEVHGGATTPGTRVLAADVGPLQ